MLGGISKNTYSFFKVRECFENIGVAFLKNSLVKYTI